MAASKLAMNQYIYKCKHGEFRGYQWLGHARHFPICARKGVRTNGAAQADVSQKPAAPGPICSKHGAIPSKMWNDHLHTCSIARAKFKNVPLDMKLAGREPVKAEAEAVGPSNGLISKTDPIYRQMQSRLMTVSKEISKYTSMADLARTKLTNLEPMRNKLQKLIDEMLK